MKDGILGLRTTIYKVSDITAAKEWYSETFATAPYFDEPFYVGFNIAGYELGLMPDGNDDREKTANVLSYWGVENIECAINDFAKHGAKLHQEPTNVGGDIVVASVIDPWENVIGLIYNPEFSLPR